MPRLVLSVILMLFFASGINSEQTTTKKRGKMVSITIESDAFAMGQPIPVEYTCDGADRSPSLKWKGFPAEAKSLALICIDPDAPAGIWAHWVAYDIPTSRDSLPEGIPMSDTLAGGGRQGMNDFGKIGYNGPCPPSGTHRYIFKLYALDRMLNFAAGKKKSEIEKAMKGHILAQGELIGTYSRTI